jgi:hypothetical protein
MPSKKSKCKAKAKAKCTTYCKIVNGKCKYADSVVKGVVHCCDNPCRKICIHDKKLSKKNKGFKKIEKHLFNVETALSETGAISSGPFEVVEGGRLRFWSGGGLFTKATKGSALVNLEPNNIRFSNGPPTDPPEDPRFPILYIDQSTGGMHVWNPTAGTNQMGDFETSSSGGATGPAGSLAVGRVFVPDDAPGGSDNNDVYDETFQVDPNEDLEISFESPSGAFGLLQNDHVVTIPETLNGVSLVGKTVYVKIQLSFSVGFYHDSSFSGASIFFVKNNSDRVSLSIGGIVNDDGDDILEYRTMTLNDIIPLTAGDFLDLYIEAGGDISIKFFDESTMSYITFEILKIEEVI